MKTAVLGVMILNGALMGAPFTCEYYNGAGPTVRATGVTEKVDDVLIVCTGGTPGATHDVTLSVSLSVPVTSANPTGTKSDALLLINDPSRSQMVANQNVFAGEFAPAAGGSSQPHTIRFTGVRMAEPEGQQTPVTILRVVNFRANVTAVAADMWMTPRLRGISEMVLATIDTTPRLAGFPMTAAVGVLADPGPITSVSASQTAGYQMDVRLQELTPSEFRVRSYPNQDQTPIGAPFYTESNVITSLFQPVGMPSAGLANSGTRIVLKFSNVPAGQQVFVSTNPIAVNTPVTSDIRLAATTEAGTVAAYSEVSPNANSPSPGVAAVPIVNGSGMAAYEVLQTDTTALEWATFGVVLQGGTGTPTVEAMYGPLASTTQTWIPRFMPPKMAVNTPAAVFRDAANQIRLIEYGNTEVYNAGGVFAGQPGAAQDGDGNRWIVAKDTSNGLYLTRFSAASKKFDNWIFLGGAAKGDPSVTVSPAGVVYYAIRDPWNSCWLGTFRPGIGNSWRYLGGVFATDPQITAAGFTIYLAGKDNWSGIWAMSFPEVGNLARVEEGWTFRGGIVQGQISLSRVVDFPILAARDQWNALWLAALIYPAGLQWMAGQGVITRDPQIAGTTAVGATNDSISTRSLFPELPWAATGGVLTSESPAWVNEELYIAGVDASGQIWWYKDGTKQWSSTGLVGLAASRLSAVPR